jgi:hypothetical protein
MLIVAESGMLFAMHGVVGFYLTTWDTRIVSLTCSIWIVGFFFIYIISLLTGDGSFLEMFLEWVFLNF